MFERDNRKEVRTYLTDKKQTSATLSIRTRLCVSRYSVIVRTRRFRLRVTRHPLDAPSLLLLSFDNGSSEKFVNHSRYVETRFVIVVIIIIVRYRPCDVFIHVIAHRSGIFRFLSIDSHRRIFAVILTGMESRVKSRENS